MPGPWLESFSEFATSSAVSAVAILIAKVLPGSLMLVLGGYFVSPLFYLFAFTVVGQLSFTMSFSLLGFYLEKLPPLLLPSIFSLQIYTFFPWKSVLSPKTLDILP